MVADLGFRKEGRVRLQDEAIVSGLSIRKQQVAPMTKTGELGRAAGLGKDDKLSFEHIC
jgi:hypothetical protein